MVKNKLNIDQRRGLIILAVIAVTVVLVMARLMLMPHQSAAPKVDTDYPTFKGTVVCLPHKDTSGPQTLECAYGLKDENGTYYALQDSDETYKNLASIPMNETVEVTGKLTTKTNEMYPTVGTIEVQDIKR